MKAKLARIFTIVAAPVFGVLIPVVGCGAADSSEPAMTEDNATMNPEEASVSTDSTEVGALEEEASAEGSLALSQDRGRSVCYEKRNCRGDTERGTSLRECFRKPGRQSWRARPGARCQNEN